eukprot:m.856746 g.856746  ORF g.856746 m.856746 type:complete len:110 (+) comp23516_c0_seq2:1941-2270(+)
MNKQMTSGKKAGLPEPSFPEWQSRSVTPPANVCAARKCITTRDADVGRAPIALASKRVHTQKCSGVPQKHRASTSDAHYLFNTIIHWGWQQPAFTTVALSRQQHQAASW